MEEDFSDASGPVFPPDNSIRSVETDLQAQLESFRRRGLVAGFMETCAFCENVRDRVLNYDDEPHLSKTQNNCRRISIASELFINICSVYGHIVDYEFTKIIDSLMQWEKYKYISKKITHKMQLELKREKYFAKEAQNKLQKSLPGTKVPCQGEEFRGLEGIREVTSRPTERTELVTELVTAHEKGSPNKEPEQLETRYKQTSHVDEIHEAVGLALEFSTRDEISSIIGNMTALRAESVIDTSTLQFPNSLAPKEANQLITSVPEIPIQETNLQSNNEDDINQILQILEGEIIETVNEMEQPVTQLETMNGTEGEAEHLVTGKSQTRGENQVDQSEGSYQEEWNLPSLEPTEKATAKRRRLITDEAIIIRNYSERALYLNSHINIQRVQVFEGPPKVLQAMSANHLMKTPAFKTSLFQDVRSSKLNSLYERHLQVEQRPAEARIVPQKRAVGERRQTAASKGRINAEIVEDFGVGVGLHSSLPRRSDVLAEIAKEKTQPENLEMSTTGVPQKQSFVGMPMSRIITPMMAPPGMETIGTESVARAPRPQQLQGKSLDPAAHSSWFYSTSEKPPSAKYKEFNYVYKKLEEYWALLESQGMEKSITLREFFHFESDGGKGNFLTVFRIVDKLSIQRKLFLEYQKQEVFIRPFEIPVVSEGQLLLKEKVPIL